jgi:hypothetical protein
MGFEKEIIKKNILIMSHYVQFHVPLCPIPCPIMSNSMSYYLRFIMNFERISFEMTVQEMFKNFEKTIGDLN